MTEIDVKGNTIHFGDIERSLRHPVKESMNIGGVFIVLLDVPQGTIDNRNVIGLSEDGDRLWEIDPISDGPTANQAYVSLYEKGGNVWVGNPIGAECRVDVHTGDFVETKTKRW